MLLKGQRAPIAQVAFAATKEAGAGTQLTIAVPTNVTLDAPAQIGPDETHRAALTYRRCLPGACFADAKLEATAVGS